MDKIRLRKPTDKDGAALHELVKQCAPLDENSRYCNLLQVSHFGDTAVVAECADALLGFITGYRVPGRDRVLFVWQLGVSPAGRGQGLAVRMLNALVARLGDIDTVETTVTPTTTPRVRRSKNSPASMAHRSPAKRCFANTSTSLRGTRTRCCSALARSA